MAEPYLGEIRIFGFQFPPKGWALANGQLLSIQQNTALFSILGTTYGGNGTSNFALPNLQGTSPIHTGNGFNLGAKAGEANHQLTIAEIPAHTHQVKGSANAADQSSPANNFWAQGNNAYNSVFTGVMSPAAIAKAGQSQPHNNMPPYLVLNFAIALQGIFPSRN
jgi:microcystin-dependent protein